MKSLRQTCAIAILSMALTGSAFAGIISSPGVVDPPPPPPSETSVTSSLTTSAILTILGLLS